MSVEQQAFYTQAVLSISVLIGLSSFLMLGQGRLLRLIFILAGQGLLLALVIALLVYSQKDPRLYVPNALILALKVAVIPWMLGRETIKMQLHGDIETAGNKIGLLLSGAGLMALSYYVLQPIVQNAPPVILNVLAISLSVVLIGMLLVISHRQAVVHVAGFLSIENGLFLAALIATDAMPIVIGVGLAFDALVATILFFIFFFHARTAVNNTLGKY